MVLALFLLAACQQTPTPAPTPAPAEPNPSGEPPVTPKGEMSTNYSDAAMAVATNDRSEVLVAGVQATYFDRGLSTAYGSKQGGQPGPLRLFVNRYSSRAEALSWSRLIEVPCPTGRTCLVRAAELALAEDGSSLLISESTQEDDAAPFWETQAILYKLSANGAVLWQKSMSEPENSRPLGLFGAADGSSYLLWQAIAEDALNDGASGIKQESYLGVRLSRLGPGGEVLWTKDIETPVSYSFDGSFYEN